MSELWIAYCWAGGEIEFAPAGNLPDGALPFIKGPKDLLTEKVSVCARLAYDGTTLLVPGVPEKESEAEGWEAVKRFAAWVGKKSGLEGIANG